MDAQGQKYFITFIDDYSRYMYLYMLHTKNEALDAFKVFKAEVEKQSGKQIKIVRTDRGGEYYGRYTESGQAQGPFARFLQDNGIVPQYTMPGSPDQNGVAERRIQTLLDMIKLFKKIRLLLNSQLNNKFLKKKLFQHYGDLQERKDQQSLVTIMCIYKTDHDQGADNDPISFSQAINSKESELWCNAMKEEMDCMSSNKVWDLVQLLTGFKPIGCKWIFKTKRDSLGNIERYIARLVAKGFTQREGIDYTDTYSPVSKKDSLRIILTLVAHFDLELHQMDVKTAFLNGELEEEVYMKQPEGFSSSLGEQLVCKLQKSIYSLKQASRQWYLKFHDVISSFEFVESVMDQCIYQKVSESKICFLVLYVDDILLATNDKGILQQMKQFLSTHFDMKYMGDVSYVIGIKIHRDRHQGVLGLSQETYINKILERFWMQDCTPTVAPIVKGDMFSMNQCPKNNLEEQMKNIPYASVVGSLMHAQVCTRPDIAFVVGMLGRYQSNPGLDHWRAAKKVLRYLQGTKNYMLTYRRSDSLEVVGYSDSDFAGCVDYRKSILGYIFMFAGGAISWKSAKQTIIATSTMEAEFVSCFEATSQPVWLKSFIAGLRLVDSISRPLQVYCDNLAVVFMAKNNKSGSRSKHINIKYLAIREHVKDQKMIIEHINTELMLADPLTKGMPPRKFKDHVVTMGLHPI
ncbi:hypothetical protein H6P81_009397 [Aristolochia fimbriata]|uniref:Integrase catalytic domain-containing protein n=1 Tax=Aristolochia fimbriata TaxID=158543 RepID=A0AAV7ENW3_ARIFI|nr:hypothetical protein H6P81_009397 [Aristolochia fimbriata]